MAKKYIKLFRIVIVGAIIVLVTLFCNSKLGKVNNLTIIETEYEIYTTEEIEDAIRCASKYFRWHFQGCELTEIWYDEERSERYASWNEKEQVILYSTFEVGSKGHSLVLSPNTTYSDYAWVLIRNSKKSKWKVIDSGYGL